MTAPQPAATGDTGRQPPLATQPSRAQNLDYVPRNIIQDQHERPAQLLVRGGDVWIAAPPLAVLARLSRLFRWLPEDRRGAAATALTVLAVALTAVMPLI